MNNKDLIAKLNNLKNISPDSAWLAGNRELLLSQISNSGAQKLSFWQVLGIDLASAFTAAAQPAYATAAFVVVLLVGTLVSAEFLSGTKPNDSLYIARIISEQVKLTTTFNTDARDRLAGQFAASHAQDISAVLANPEFNTEDNKDEVAALSDSFNKEMNTVKDRITRLAVSAKGRSDAAAELLTIADSAKDQSGIQLFENGDSASVSGQPAIVPAVSVLSSESSESSLAATATLSADARVAGGAAGATTSSSTLEAAAAPESSEEAIKILDEAKELFDAKDYGKASDKLKEINEIIK